MLDTQPLTDIDLMAKNYSGAKITNIRRGNGNRSHIVYAHIVNAQGELLVSATLDYCVERMNNITRNPNYSA